MATKLSAEQGKRLSALGIKATTEDDARKKLLKVLEENDLVDMAGEDTDMLLDLAESVIETSEEDDNEDNGEVPPEENATTIEEMKDFLLESGEFNKKEIKNMDDEEVEAAYNELVNGSDDEEEEAPAPPKKEAKTPPDPEKKGALKKEASKKEVKEEAAPAKKPVVAPKKEAAKKESVKRGTKMNPRDNEEDRNTIINILSGIFPEKEYIYAWIATSGVTIKFKGKNSNRALVLIENLSQKEDGIYCNLFFLPFGKKKEILDEAGIDYSTSWNNVPFVKSVEMKEVVELIEQFESELKDSVKIIDKKMGINRAKMEENLKGEKETPAKKIVTAKKKTVPPTPAKRIVPAKRKIVPAKKK